jgi:hypothetical protein
MGDTDQQMLLSAIKEIASHFDEKMLQEIATAQPDNSGAFKFDICFTVETTETQCALVAEFQYANRRYKNPALSKILNPRLDELDGLQFSCSFTVDITKERPLVTAKVHWGDCEGRKYEEVL